MEGSSFWKDIKQVLLEKTLEVVLGVYWKVTKDDFESFCTLA